MKLDESKKELHIIEVIEYNEELKDENIGITIQCMTLGVVALYVIFNVARGIPPLELPQFFMHIFFASIFLDSVFDVVKNLVKKTKLNIEIEKIRELFASHGLVLEDELSKSKGM